MVKWGGGTGKLLSGESNSVAGEAEGVREVRGAVDGVSTMGGVSTLAAAVEEIVAGGTLPMRSCRDS